jgi:3-phosphoshikimate 1-carboxyvinyltransferase
MRRLRVRPASRLAGRLRVPGDKSISHRAVILGGIAAGESSIRGFLTGDDCLRTARAMQALGVPIDGLPGASLRVHGVGLRGLRKPKHPLDMGNSGTGMRLLIGLMAGQGFEATVTGDESLSRRPMDRIAVPLEQMGARVIGRGDQVLPPVTVRGGPLRGVTYRSPMASAQVKSAILLAGLNAEGQTTVIEPARSRDHTERMLQAMGADLQVDDLAVTLTPGPPLAAQDVTVPADFSSAACFLVASLLVPAADVLLEDVLLNPTRAALLECLQAMGAEVNVLGRREVAGEPVGNLSARPDGLLCSEVGGEMIPRLIDEVPLLAVVATQAEGKTAIRDASELRVKESDRLAAIAHTLTAMGARVQELADGLDIVGPTTLHGAAVSSHGDHRIAMAAAVAGLVAEGETVIEDTECVDTSVPGFVESLRALGADCVEEEH